MATRTQQDEEALAQAQYEADKAARKVPLFNLTELTWGWKVLHGQKPTPRAIPTKTLNKYFGELPKPQPRPLVLAAVQSPRKSVESPRKSPGKKDGHSPMRPAPPGSPRTGTARSFPSGGKSLRYIGDEPGTPAQGHTTRSAGPQPEMSAEEIRAAKWAAMRRQNQDLQNEVAVLKHTNRILTAKISTLEECVAANQEEITMLERTCEKQETMIKFRTNEATQYRRELERLSERSGVPRGEDDPAGNAWHAQMMEQLVGAGSAGAMSTASMLVDTQLLELERKSAQSESMMSYMGEMLKALYALRTGNEVAHVVNQGAQTDEVEFATEEEQVIEEAIVVKKKPRKPVPGVPVCFIDLITRPQNWSTRIMTMRMTLEAIVLVYTDKIIADEADIENKVPLEVMPVFVIEHMLRRYGVKPLADYHAVELAHALEAHMDRSRGCRLFGRFLGLTQSWDDIPLSGLNFYLNLLGKLRYKRSTSLGIEVGQIPGTEEAPSRGSSAARSRPQSSSTRGGSRPGSAVSQSSRQLCMLVHKSKAMVILKAAFENDPARNARVLERVASAGIYPNSSGAPNERVDLDLIMSCIMMEWDEQRKEQDMYMKAVYEAADVDGTGQLNFTEFSTIMKQLDPGQSDSMISRMFREAVSKSDTDQLDLDLFCAVLHKYSLDKPPVLE